MSLRFKVALVAAALASLGLVGSASPAQASKCDPELDTACRMAATVMCEVVTKDKPCPN